jgi:hypothetical protein
MLILVDSTFTVSNVRQALLRRFESPEVELIVWIKFVVITNENKP